MVTSKIPSIWVFLHRTMVLNSGGKLMISLGIEYAVGVSLNGTWTKNPHPQALI